MPEVAMNGWQLRLDRLRIEAMKRHADEQVALAVSRLANRCPYCGGPLDVWSEHRDGCPRIR